VNPLASHKEQYPSMILRFSEEIQQATADPL